MNNSYFIIIFKILNGVGVNGAQIEKLPLDVIKNDLKSAGMSEAAIEELLRVLSIKSLTELEGWF